MRKLISKVINLLAFLTIVPALFICLFGFVAKNEPNENMRVGSYILAVMNGVLLWWLIFKAF